MATPLTGLGTYVVSGMLPASGTQVGASAGPWLIEEQDLKITYVRVPNYSSPLITHSLSGPARTEQVQQTYLQCIVEANYSRQKSSALYTTSSWTQAQTFDYQPREQDAFGNSYGAVGVSALGPAGVITTSAKWYQRRYWTPDDSTTVESCIGTTHYFKGTPYYDRSTSSIVYPGPSDGTAYFGQFGRSNPAPTEPNRWINSDEYFSHSFEYFLPQPYSVSLESPLQIQNWIDSLGNKVSSFLLYDLGSNLEVSEGAPWTAVPSTGCPSYSVSRHGW